MANTYDRKTADSCQEDISSLIKYAGSKSIGASDSNHAVLLDSEQTRDL